MAPFHVVNIQCNGILFEGLPRDVANEAEPFLVCLNDVATVSLAGEGIDHDTSDDVAQ